MSVKKRKQDALKAKEKKQKIIAGVGGVLLVGLLAFQVPRVMKQMNRGGGGPPPPPAAVTTTPGTTPSLAAPTTMQDPSTAASSGTGASTSSSSGSSAGLITSSTSGATSGELASFSRFESKDPFAQQVQDNGGSTSSSSSSPSSSGSGSSGSGTPVSTGGSTSSGSTGGGGSQPAPGTAVISVNGTLMSVTVGSDFPQPTTSDPNATALFHLVSLTNTTAKIAIAGGSYTSGAHTVTLHVNKPVTLMNTADGSRFKLILKPQGTAVPGDAGSTSTTPTVTLPAATP
jgi:hypothetical protein